MDELVQDRLVGRAAGAALRHQKRRAERGDEGGDLRHEAVADRELGEDVGGLGQGQAVPGHADDDAAEDIDREHDQARDGVAAHELRGTVHRAEEGALLLEFAAPALGFLVVDQAGRQVGVDRHLLARDGVEGEAGADFRDTGRALGDNDEVDRDDDGEDDEADDEVAAHHEAREPADDIAGRIGAFRAVGPGSAGWWRCSAPAAAWWRRAARSGRPRIRAAARSTAPPSGSAPTARSRTTGPCRSGRAGSAERRSTGSR